MENVGLSEYAAHEAEKAFYKNDRHAIRQLAPLWDPESPVYENEAYVAHAKEFKQVLESTLLSTRAGDALDDGEAKIKEGKAEG